MQKSNEFLSQLPFGWHRMVSPRAVQVLFELSMYSEDGKSSTVAYPVMMKELDISRSAIENAVDDLEEHGLLEHTTPAWKGPNTYSIPSRARRTKNTRSSTTEKDAADSNDQRSPRGHRLGVQGPIIHDTSNSTYRVKGRNRENDEAALVSPAPLPFPVLNPLPVNSTHPSAETTVNSGGADPSAGRVDGWVEPVGSVGKDADWALETMLACPQFTPAVARKIARDTDDARLVRNVELWANKRKAGAKIGPGACVQYIRADTAASEAHDRDKRRRRQQESKSERGGRLRVVGTDALTEQVVKQGEKVALEYDAAKASIEALDEAAFDALCADVLRTAPNPFIAKRMEKYRPSARNNVTWLHEFARHFAHTKSPPAKGNDGASPSAPSATSE